VVEIYPRLGKLYKRAKAAGAIENYRDAVHDLAIWPDLHKEILDDLEQAVEAWEKINERRDLANEI
jgi:hypothetical protein